MKKRIQVVGALILNKNQEFLICQRPKNKQRALLWEFVGGKVEQNESLQEALIRECKEELDIEIKPIRLFGSVSYDYPDILIDLSILECKLLSDKITIKEHNDIKWIKASEIDNYDFCPADIEILEQIKKEITD